MDSWNRLHATRGIHKLWHEYVCNFFNVNMQITTSLWLHLELDFSIKTVQVRMPRISTIYFFSSHFTWPVGMHWAPNFTFWKAIYGFNLILNCAKLFNPLNLIFHQEFIISEARESTQFCVSSYQGDQYILSQIYKSLQSLYCTKIRVTLFLPAVIGQALDPAHSPGKSVTILICNVETENGSKPRLG